MELYDPNANVTVDDINKVPADFRAMYKEADGKHVLDAENPVVKSSLTILGSLKGVLTKARNDLKTATGKAVDLTPLSGYGATPAEIATAVQTKLDELTGAIKNGKVDTEAVKKAVAGEWSGKLNASEQKAVKLAGQLTKTLVNGAAATAINAAKGKSKALMPLVTQQVKTVVSDDGEFSVQVVQPDGSPRYNGSGGFMTIDELVAEMKADKDLAALFDSDAPAGGGAKPGAARQAAAAAAAAARGNENLTATELIQRGLRAAAKRK